MKYLAQILASVVYSYFYTAIMYLVIVLPLTFVLSLPWWGMLLTILFAGGLIEGITNLLAGFGSIPFFWILKKNVVAKYLAICITIANLGYCIITMWKSLLGNGFWAITLGLVVTAMVIKLVWATYIRIEFAYHGMEE